MGISLVVPAYIYKPEQVAMTNRCLMLASQKTGLRDFELIIVESGGHYLKNYPCDIYINERKAEHSGRSMNRAFACATQEYTVLLTNDVYVNDGWLECLKECFQIRDCGISTLASTQFGHTKKELITEDIWFSVAMWKTQGKIFDERFVNVWDDSDFTMREYLAGRKSYMNHNCVVEHLIGQTQYARVDHKENYEKGRTLFIEKYKDCGHPMYNKLAGI